MKVAEMIKEARRLSGKTQAEIAELTETFPSNVSRYESGAVIPKTDTFVKLIEACGFKVVIGK